jgi:hypothetical protein
MCQLIVEFVVALMDVGIEDEVLWAAVVGGWLCELIELDAMDLVMVLIFVLYNSFNTFIHSIYHYSTVRSNTSGNDFSSRDSNLLWFY